MIIIIVIEGLEVKMKIRIISSIFMLLIFIPLLLLGDLAFAILMALIAVLALYEILKAHHKVRKIPYYIELYSYILVFLFTINNYNSAISFYMLDYRLLSFLIVSLMLPLVFVNDKDKYDLNDAMFLIGSTLFIGLTLNLLVLFRGYNLNYVIYLFLITTMTDIYAYLTGSMIGKHKLAPKISPKKTVEGLIGGMLMATITAGLFYYNVIGGPIGFTTLLIMTAILSIIGQLGDLVFSFIKREFGLKDFSNIIPGHGGILDRLDSIIFVTLGFLIFLSVL